jgi:hypothetical protein
MGAGSWWLSDTESDQRPEGEAEGDGEDVVCGGEFVHAAISVRVP